VNINGSDTDDSEASSDASTSDSTTNGPTTDDSTTDGPTTDGPTTDGPTTDSDTTTGDPTTGPTTGDPTTDGTTSEGTTTDGTTTDGTTSEGTTGGIDGSCPDGWTKARPVTITNNPNKPLDDYQISVSVDWDDNMQVDFSDLRFIDGEGALLPHWIEDYTAPVDALVWVRVPAVAPAATTAITMCYGNPDAQNASDGFTTFDFFDDFEAAELDTNKWTPTSPVSISLGVLKIPKGSVYSKGAPGSFPNDIIEAKMHLEGNDGGNPGLRVGSSQTGVEPGLWMALGGFFNVVGENLQPIVTGNFKGAECCTTTQSIVYGLAVDEGNAYVFAKRKHSAFGIGTWSKPYFIGLGDGQMKNAGESDIYDTSVDWVLVRQFTSVEPTTEVGEEVTL
jgi:hypothetical protein